MASAAPHFFSRGCTISPDDLALRILDHAVEAGRQAAQAAAEAARALLEQQRLAREQTERLERRCGALDAECGRLRDQVGELEGEAERLRDQLAAARAETPDARARSRAVAQGWSLVGDILRHPRIRGALVAVVTLLLGAAAVASARALGVDIPIPSLLVPNAPPPSP